MTPGQVVASDDEFEYVVKRFGDLEVGDEIPDDNDDWETVVEVYDEHLPESMYEVTTDEGQVVEVSGNHLWYVETSLDRSLHAHRLKNSAKVLQRCLSEEVVEAFEMIATDDDNEYLIETMLKDMIELSESRDPELLGVFSRIAESVGMSPRTMWLCRILRLVSRRCPGLFEVMTPDSLLSRFLL